MNLNKHLDAPFCLYIHRTDFSCCPKEVSYGNQDDSFGQVRWWVVVCDSLHWFKCALSA